MRQRPVNTQTRMRALTAARAEAARLGIPVLDDRILYAYERVLLDQPEPTSPACVFCAIIDGREPADIVARWNNAIAIVPLDPVTPGHLLVIPHRHTTDWVASPAIAAVAMHRAAELASERGIWPANLITSAGREATQSVFHTHLHIIPRADNDGLALPWYSGRRSVKPATMNT